MKIFKSNYGWSITAHSTNPDGTKNEVYLDTQFPKGEEPVDTLEGDLIFRTKDGEEKKCFFSSYKKKDGTTPVKLVFNKSKTIIEQTTLTGDGRDMLGHIDNNKVVIEEDNLPFY